MFPCLCNKTTGTKTKTATDKINCFSVPCVGHVSKYTDLLDYLARNVYGNDLLYACNNIQLNLLNYTNILQLREKLLSSIMKVTLSIADQVGEDIIAKNDLATFRKIN